MHLTRVTITGAGDATSVEALADLSGEYGFVEWGILVSNQPDRGRRFPGPGWIEQFAAMASARKCQVSTHVCGPWVRQILEGTIHWDELPVCVGVSERLQINAHSEPPASATGLLKSLGGFHQEFIFPWDDPRNSRNHHLALAAKAAGHKTAVLFDGSGGTGTLPASWPAPAREFWCGYAGGLGPHNVVAEVRKIERVCNQPYWIDMERRVRTNDDRLDLTAVRSVLKAVADLLGPDGRDVNGSAREARGS